MIANNETGVIQQLHQIRAILDERSPDTLLHTDAVQAFPWLDVSVLAEPADLISLSGHKFGGPKGVGLLYVRRRRPRIRIEPLLHGGGHEGGRRSGTLPVGLIAGFAKAVELCCGDREQEAKRLLGLRERFWARLSAGLPDAVVNGDLERRLPGNLSVTFPGPSADALIAGLPQIALSAGSACASGSGEPSHVLRALGLSDVQARSTLRFGLGRSNDAEQLDWVADQLIEVARGLHA